MFANKLTTKKNEKRVSLSVLAASKSVRRSIKIVNKQSKFHLSCHAKKLEKVSETRPQRMEIQPIIAEKPKTESNTKNNISVSKTPSTNTISLKERIAMSSNRLAMNKHPVESIRQRNQFNTPNTAKRPNLTNNNNEHLNKRFNSAHVNFNTNSSSSNTKSATIIQRKLFTPSVNTASQTPRLKSTRLATTNNNLNRTPSLNTKTPTNRFNSNIKSAKSVTTSTIKNNIDRAKSSVRRSIQLLNNNLKTPTTSNFRKNLFQSGSKIPLYTPNSKQHPKTEERKPTQSKISEHLKNLTKTTEVKSRRRSSRFSGRLSDIESSCLILTPKLMRQLLSKASESASKTDDINKIVEEEEEEEPIKVKTIKPSSLIKYLFSEKQKVYDADLLKAKLNEEENKNDIKDDSSIEKNEIILQEGSINTNPINEINNTNNAQINDDNNIVNVETKNETIKFLDESNKEKVEENVAIEINNEIAIEIINNEIQSPNSDQVSNECFNKESQVNTNSITAEELITVQEAENSFSRNVSDENEQRNNHSNQQSDNIQVSIQENEQPIEKCQELNLNHETPSSGNTTGDNINISVQEEQETNTKPAVTTEIVTHVQVDSKNEEAVIISQKEENIETEKNIEDKMDKLTNEMEYLIENQENNLETENIDNKVLNKLNEKILAETPRTPNGKKRKYTKKIVRNVQKDEDVESSIQNQENIPNESTINQQINEEDYSIGKTIEIQTDFDADECNDECSKVVDQIDSHVAEKEVVVEAPAKATRKKREKKVAAKPEHQPLEEIENEGRVLTRAQRAKLNQKA